MEHHRAAGDQPAAFEVVPTPLSALPQTAALHRELLPHGLFPSLGDRFVRRWHATFVDSPYGVSAVAVDAGGRCCGFLLGTIDQRRYTSQTLRDDGVALAAWAALGLLRRPRLAVHFLRTRAGAYLRRVLATRLPAQAQAVPPPAGQPVAVLHAVATTPGARGQGVAAALVAHFEQELRRHGARRMQLVTRADGGAAGFYRRLGYEETDRRPNRDGVLMIQFDRDLTGPA